MKILVIQFYQIGDVILTTPVFSAIKNKYKDSEIHFLTTKVPSFLIDNNPHIDEIKIIERKQSIMYMIDWIKKIRKERYDYILDFQNNPRSTWLTLFSASKHRVTYSFTKRKFAYNELITPPEDYIGKRKISMLKALSIESNKFRPELFIDKKSLGNAQEYLNNYKIKDFIIVSPTHRRETRRWPLEYFIDIAQNIYERYNLRVIFNHSPDEKEYVLPIKEHKLYNKIFFMPDMTLKELVAFISLSKFHFGNDSAPNHIATALNIPSFIIFGSTQTKSWVYPDKKYKNIMKNLECQPCDNNKCKYEEIKCLTDLTVGEVINKLDDFIKELQLIKE